MKIKKYFFLNRLKMSIFRAKTKLEADQVILYKR